MRYQFMQDQYPAHCLARLCAALGVSRSGYYAWRRRPESARHCADRQLLAAIEALHTRMRGRYGAIKTWRALTAAGLLCGRHRVARLRRLHGLEAQRTRRFRVMTEHHHLPPPAPNRLRPGFQVVGPDHVWAGDLTAVPTREGWLYVAVLLDLYSRRVVGWAMGARITTDLTHTALTMAVQQRQVGARVLHHSDRGSQYTAERYQQGLTRYGLQCSMSRPGNCWDNAVVESFFASLKTELIYRRRFQTRQEAQTAIFTYIEGFYNRRRRHSTLGYVAPVEFEQR